MTPRILLAALLLVVAACAPAHADTGAIGYGAGTTGGSAPCRVSPLSAAALEACAHQPGTLITFAGSGTIVLDHTVNLSSNQTIAGPVQLVGPGTLLQIADKSNVVVRGVSFSSNQGGHCLTANTPEMTLKCGVSILIKGDVKNVWIDRNDFSHCGEKCLEIWNEGLAPLDSTGHTVTPDLITVSKNHFRDTYFCMAAGVSATTPNSAIRSGGERITVVGNTFDRCFRRSVRAASGAEIHEIGNLIERWGPESGPDCQGINYGFGPSAIGGGQILLERNTFVPWPNGPCREAVDLSDYHTAAGVERGRGMLRSVNNRTLGGARVTQAHPEEVFQPPYSVGALPTPSE